MKQHSSHFRRIGVYLHHQPFNLRNENLLSTPERRCTWPAKKDLNSAGMDTLTKSCRLTTVITANREVQTHEEATVYVKELDIFLTMKVLEDTPAVLSQGKLCDEHEYSYEWINAQNPHLIKNGIRTQCNTENFVPIVVPGLSSSFSSSLPSSTPMTSSTEIDHSDHRAAIVSSESVDRQVRGGPYGKDHHPAGRPVFFLTSEELLYEPNQMKMGITNSIIPTYPNGCKNSERILVDDRVPEHRDSHASSSDELSFKPKHEKCGFG